MALQERVLFPMLQRRQPDSCTLSNALGGLTREHAAIRKGDRELRRQIGLLIRGHPRRPTLKRQLRTAAVRRRRHIEKEAVLFADEFQSPLTPTERQLLNTWDAVRSDEGFLLRKLLASLH